MEITAEFDALVASVVAEDGALPPEVEIAHNALQDEILNLQHATAF